MWAKCVRIVQCVYNVDVIRNIICGPSVLGLYNVYNVDVIRNTICGPSVLGLYNVCIMLV